MTAAGEPADESVVAPELYRIRSVERVVDILDILARAEGPVTLTEIAGVAGLPRSSAFRYLTTLELRGYATRDAAGSYQLGPGFPHTSDRTIAAIEEAAKPPLLELAGRHGETVNLAVLAGSRVRYLHIVESPRQVRLAARPGDRDPLHCTALGKVIAAVLPERDVRRIVELEGMPRRTDRTITDVDELLAELELVRRDGYALDDRENESDGRCIAVLLPDVAPHAAISFSAPAFRFPPEQVAAIAEELTEVAERISAEAREILKES